MTRLPHIAIIFAAVLLVAADKKDEDTKPSAAEIQQWVKQLGDDDFKVREEATRNLLKTGGFAFDAVLKATKSEDTEVKQRALKIIKQIEKNKDLLKHAIRFGFRWDEFEQIENLGTFFQKDPSGAVQILTNTLMTLDIENKDDIHQVAQCATLLASVGSDAALKRLDEMYVKWSGKKHIYFRDRVVRSLVGNPLYLYPPIIKKKPKQVKAILERWLIKEDDRSVLELGLRILSDRQSTINPEILKNAKGKISDYYFRSVVRRARINGMKDPQAAYREVVKWLEEMITLFEPTELDNTASNKSFYDNSHSYEPLVYSLISILHANPSVLKGHQEELEKMRQQCLEIVEQLAKKRKETEARRSNIAKTVKDPKDRSLQYIAIRDYLYILRVKEINAANIVRYLDYYLERIQKESSEKQQKRTGHP